MKTAATETVIYLGLGLLLVFIPAVLIYTFHERAIEKIGAPSKPEVSHTNPLKVRPSDGTAFIADCTYPLDRTQPEIPECKEQNPAHNFPFAFPIPPDTYLCDEKNNVVPLPIEGQAIAPGLHLCRVK